MISFLLDEILKRSTRTVVRVLTTTIGCGDPTSSCEDNWSKSNISEETKRDGRIKFVRKCACKVHVEMYCMYEPNVCMCMHNTS